MNIKLERGSRFGRLSVAGPIWNGKRTVWVCICDCGAITSGIQANKLTSGHTNSCGCLKKEIISIGATLRHGQSKSGKGGMTSEYRRWYAIKQRCYNPGNSHYKYYGARGIMMCDRWKNDFAKFFEDMGKCPPGRVLDRKDNDGMYEPGNCHWITMRESNRNYSSNVNFTYNGETMCLRDWADRFNVGYKRLWNKVCKSSPDMLVRTEKFNKVVEELLVRDKVLGV